MIRTIFLIPLLWLMLGCQPSENTVFFESNWAGANRVWIGPDYWSNPMQDWQVDNGRIECIVSGGDRNLFLLTYELDSALEDFTTQVSIGKLSESLSTGWTGFKIGVMGEFDDYRDSAVRGEGMPVGIDDKGRLFIGFIDPEAPTIDIGADQLTLVLDARVNEQGNYRMQLEVYDVRNELLATHIRDQVANDLVIGGLALACSATPPLEVKSQRHYIEYPDWGTEENTSRTGDFRFWFKDWTVKGSKLKHYPERSFGPVLFTQFTVTNNLLNLTAQMPPVGENDGHEVVLEFQQDGSWQPIGTSTIDPLSRTAKFSSTLPDNYPAVPYRVTYSWGYTPDETNDHHFEGLIPAEPDGRVSMSIAAFTGNNDLGFPNSDLVQSVVQQRPDFLFFSGDQIYEGVGGYGVQRGPVESASLDYLRKWYLFGWTYYELMREIPSVAIPDDHDVYHGNIWGESGKAANTNLESHHDQQDSGGYKMHPDWVNMVQRTQTGHLPKPYDPTPVKQGIGVYYTNIEYAGISFAVLEDRKFKSSPTPLLPEGKITNGWAQNPDFNPVTDADHSEAILLGQRQLEFLDWWAANWGSDTWMKIVLSQTIFANVATLPRAESRHDRIVPQLRILNTGEYADDDVPVSDMDSNGWPQTGRNNALRTIRKAFALHIAGDQHLGSTIQYGIEEYGDAGYAICVPSVSNVWPRRWYPPKNPETGSYTGDYLDGFGNKMTVFAISNPVFTGRKPSKLYDRATGYGIVRLDKNTREIVLENWPREAYPSHGQPYEGWPVKLHQSDNYRPPSGGYLPILKYQGKEEPLIQAWTASGQLVWSIKLPSGSTDLMVPAAGTYILTAILNHTRHEYKTAATKNPNERSELEIKL